MERLPFGDPFLENRDLNEHLRRVVEKLVSMGIVLREAQEEVEKLYIERTLLSCQGNRSRAARRLGMHRNTLNARMDKYGLNGGHGP